MTKSGFNPVATRAQALSCIKAGRFAYARELLLQVCRALPGDGEAWFLLGTVQLELQSFEDAARCLEKAVAINPDSATAHYNLGQAYLKHQMTEEAVTNFREVVRLAPDVTDGHTALGYALASLDRLEEARGALQQSLALDPLNAIASHTLGQVLMGLGAGMGHVIECFRKTVTVRPEWPQAHIELGFALLTTGELAEAVTHFRVAQTLEPASSAALAGLVSVHEKKGEYSTAWELLYSRAGLLSHPEAGDVEFVMAFARLARKLEHEQDGIDVVQKLLSNGGLLRADRQALHFQLGRLYERLEDYQQAFDHFAKSNQLKRVGGDERILLMGETIRVFTLEFMAGAPRASNHSTRPVFIVGMPRSGTSLVEHILGCHPDVYAASELDDMRVLAQERLPDLVGSRDVYPHCMKYITGAVLDEIARQYLDRLTGLSADALRVTDKMPHNFLYLGLIELLFPGARVIHCKRNPLDTCVSIYTNDFLPGHAYATDLAKLGRHYRHYQSLMQHWSPVLSLPICEIQYEDLVGEQERLTREILDFCGLEWDERCLQFHTSERIVSTHSYDQVRQPLYTTSVGRWKHYEAYLEPLIESLGSSV
jgi:tetratricopeptide (TPR) repeat protein